MAWKSTATTDNLATLGAAASYRLTGPGVQALAEWNASGHSPKGADGRTEPV